MSSRFSVLWSPTSRCCPVTPADLDALECFFFDRGARVQHEVSPLAGMELAQLLVARGYRPIEFTNVLYRPIGRDLPLECQPNPRVSARPITPDECDVCADTAALGWSQAGDFSNLMRDLARASIRKHGAVPFLAWLDDKPAAAANLNLVDTVAHLAGASTVPAARRQGAQLAVLSARLRFAAEHGCDVALMGAVPGSASQRNAERHGFRIAYTRTKWELAVT